MREIPSGSRSSTIRCREWTASASPERSVAIPGMQASAWSCSRPHPPGDTQIAEQAGINAFLTKPARIADLYDCLATLLVRPEEDGGDRHHETSLLVHRQWRTDLRRGLPLVVDDNPVNQRVALRMLEKMGHIVDIADNGIGRSPHSARHDTTRC